MPKLKLVLVFVVITLAQVLLGFFGGAWVLETQFQKGYRAGVDSQTAIQEARAAEERTRQQKEKDSIENDAKQKINEANSDAERARSTSDRLQLQLARIKDAASRGGATVTPSTSAEQAVNMLADMLRSSIELSTNYARFADQAYAAGMTCQNQYLSLRGSYEQSRPNSAKETDRKTN